MPPFSKLRAVVLDWAGTVVDFGSQAPMGVFVETFRRFGVAISIDEARGPMGMAKRDHIAAVLTLPRVAEAWASLTGKEATEADVDALYETFVPLNVEVITRYAGLVPGAAATVAGLRARGLKIGSTTGYTREIMAPLLPVAAAQGYAPDNLVCAGDLAAGRPSPMMMYRTFLDLAVWPAAALVKVDDTGVGIAEGLAAGTWTVGLAVSGNAFGLSLEETSALDADAYTARRSLAYARLTGAGAHHVIDTIADLPPVLDVIEGRLIRGERP